MSMELYARQGDLVFDKRAVSGDLVARTNLVLAGETSAPHTVQGKVLARQEGLRTFLRVAETTQVMHAGRHLPITLDPGDYEVRPLRERGDSGDRAVED